MDNKKKRKRKKKTEERGRRRRWRRRKGPLRKRLDGAKGKDIYTEVVYSDTERKTMRRDYLVVAGGLNWCG